MATAAQDNEPVTLKALRERSGELKNEAKDLLDKKARRSSDWKESDQEKFDALIEEVQSLRVDIENHTNYNSLTDWKDAGGEGAQLVKPSEPGEKQAREIMFRTNAGIANYAPADLSTFSNQVTTNAEYDKIVQTALRAGKTGGALLDSVYRAAQNAGVCPEGATGSSIAEGAFLQMPTQWAADLLRCCDKVTKMRGLATIFTVNEACNLGVHTRTKRTSAAKWGNACEMPDCDTPGFGAKFLQPHIITACTAWCREIQRNTSAPIVDWYSQEAARDVNEVMETGYLYGNGNGQPVGLLHEESLDPSRYTNMPTACTVDQLVDFLIDLICKIPECFSGGNLGWLMSKEMHCCLMKLRGDGGLWLGESADRGLAGKLSTTLFGDPIIVSEFINGTVGGTAGQVPIMYGDFSQYWIADKNSMLIEREDCPGADRSAIYTRMWTGGIPMCEEAFAGGLIV